MTVQPHQEYQSQTTVGDSMKTEEERRYSSGFYRSTATMQTQQPKDYGAVDVVLSGSTQAPSQQQERDISRLVATEKVWL